MIRSLGLLSLFATLGATAQSVPPAIIPAPVSVVMGEGVCSLQCLLLVPGEGTGGVEQILKAEWNGAMPVPSDCDETRAISMYLVRPDTVVNEETYWLKVTTGAIELTAVTPAGLFRGSRTLAQLIEQGKGQGSIPCLSITDFPRFPWRGMHLDVCRHFFPVDFVKEYIDLLARYRMNTFHWHLTDDQGWRIEIKKYPKLTEVGAWRSGSQVGPFGRREYDTLRYGGFYTQEQIKEVVAYAAQRHITVVPEIEMPGHALAALAAYPRLSCTGGPFEVQKGWGVLPDVFCPGADSTFAFLEGVLDEVIALFPSPYIHIGGDECPHERWEQCPRCQARMKAEGLKSMDEVQSYFIRRIERYVNGKGRRIIGWDEILKGGLAPDATVMSWTGIEGGIAAAKSGHDAVMCPGSHCYFDHYQGDPAYEPLAIGGNTTLQKVYGYEPVPDGLTPQQATHILGAQGNLWTEYIQTPEHLEYMALPRMAALAEVLWTPKKKRNEKDFLLRLEQEFQRLEAKHVNASMSLYQVHIQLSPGEEQGTLDVRFDAPAAERGITSWSEPPMLLGFREGRYHVSQDCAVFAAAVVAPDGSTGDTSRIAVHFNKATARKVTWSTPPNERYAGDGPFTLVDGITAQEKRVNSEWVGWRQGVTITVDLGSVQDINHIGIGALNETYGWVHAPKVVEFSTSTDGRTYSPLGISLPQSDLVQGRTEMGRPWETMSIPLGRHAFIVDKAAKARYVRLVVQHIGDIPQGYPGAGSAAWLLLDEIEVR